MRKVSARPSPLLHSSSAQVGVCGHDMTAHDVTSSAQQCPGCSHADDARHDAREAAAVDVWIMFQLFELAMFGLPSPWPVRSKVARQLLARWLARRHVLAMQRSGLSASSRRHHQHDHTPRTTRFKLQQHPQLHQKLSAHPPSFGCTLRVGVEVWRLGLTEVERLDRSGLEEMRSGIE